MFESNQSIMLMGAAETIDVSAHLANANNSHIESESNDNANYSSVIHCYIINNIKLNYIFLDVFRNRINKLRQYLLC